MKKTLRRFLSVILSVILVFSVVVSLPDPIRVLAEENTENQESSPNSILYVDGIGSGEKDGTSAANAFATLTDAYNAIQENNSLAVIVICGSVNAVDGCSDPGGAGSYYFLPEHSGEVILTSVWGTENFKENAELKFGAKNFYLFGNTILQNIRITEKANNIYANYHSVHLADGIETTDTIAEYLYMGTTSKVSNPKVDDVSFIMDSGSIKRVYGGGQNWQGAVAAGKNNKVELTVNGGTIATVLYGSGHGNTDNAHHKSINITINGGTVASIYGAHGDATVYENVQINLNGGTVSAARGAYKYTAGTNANTDFTPTIYGNVEITLAGASVTTFSATYDDTTIVKGDKILTYTGRSEVSLPNAARFNVLRLYSSSLHITENRNAIWEGFTKLILSDDSILKLDYMPTDTTLKAVTVSKTGAEWQTTNPLITAPANTPELFALSSPLGYTLEHNGTAASWTLKEAELNIGSQGTPGRSMDLDLGLGNGAYTSVPADADAYTTFLYKLNDLGDAKEEVNVLNPVTIQGEVELYVSPDGSDTNIGSVDAPFKTIAKALELIQPLQELGVQGIVVYLREGTYVTSESIALNQLHSGTNDIPVIISAFNNEEVIISGGIDIAGSAFSAVTDEAILGRLKEDVKDKIVAVNLSTQGISSFAPIAGGTQGGPTCQIFVNGQELTLSRYPNVKNLPLGTVLDIGPVTVTNSNFAYDPDTSSGVEYEMQDLRPTTWVNDGNIWLKGSLYAEWDITNIRVAEIRTEKGTVKLDGGARYGARSLPSNTYYYYNVLEEMDVPGEYYLDSTNGILYLYPIGDMSNATVTYSAMSEDIIVMNGTENVVLNGLTIENGAGRGIYMSDCSRTVVQNCTIRQVGTGVVINGSRESGVIYSDIGQIANRPVEITPEHTLFDYTPSHNFLQNCYIHSTGTKNEKYSGVYMQGTGNVVSHNLIQGTFSVSIYLYLAKECVVEYNEIVGGPTGTSDCGAIYFGYTPNDSGCHIRYNYIHDIGRFSDSNAPNGIYFDEGNSGNFAYGNVIRNIPRGFFTNSGSENVIVNNIVMDGRTGTVSAISGGSIFDNYTTAARIARTGAVTKVWNTWQNLSDDEKAALKDRYPLQDALYQHIAADMAEDNGASTGLFVSHGNYAANNLIYDCGGIGFAGGTHTVTDNTIVESDPFVDVTNHNYTLMEGVSWDVDENVPLIHMEKVGVTRTLQGVDTFSMYAPFDGNTSVDPKRVLLKWSNAGGADTYELVIATNELLTENVFTVTTESQYCYFEDFAFDQTYYWKVTAKTTAKTRVAAEVNANGGAVYSFKTMTEEEYKELNQVDLTDLEELIVQAKAFLAEMKEITEGGLYNDGSKAALNTAITDAEAVIELGSDLMQEEVELAERELSAAIELAKLSRQVQYVTFEEWNAEDWVDKTSSNGTAVVVDNELRLTSSTGTSRAEMIYDVSNIGVRDILTFKFCLDTLGNWNGFAIAQSNTGAFITSAAATDGYFICIKSNQFELQKRKGGTSYGNVVVVENNDILTAGEWHDIQLAAINEADGSVRVLFKVNDTTVFDYVDTENPITGAGGFGVVVQPENVNGYARFQTADLSMTEGYTAGISADDVIIEMGDKVSIKVSAGHASQTAFNADGLVISYDKDKLVFDKTVSTLGGAQVTDDNTDGKLRITNYGDDRSFGDIYTLVFDTTTTGTATVKLDSAGFINKEGASQSDLLAATIHPGIVNLTINEAEFSVTIPTDLKDVIEGDTKVAPGSSYEFTVLDTNYTYEFSVTMGGESVAVTTTNGVNFIVNEVTDDLTISLVTKTPKSYNVTYEGSGAGDVTNEDGSAAAGTTATYNTSYVFKINATVGYGYQVGMTLNGEAYTGYTVSEEGNVYTIPGGAITGAVVITVEKTFAEATVSVTGDGAGIASGYETTVEAGKAYVLTVVPEAGYLYTITATMGGNSIELTQNDAGTTYTTPSVNGNIVFSISRTVDTSSVEVKDKVNIDSKTVYAVSYTTRLADNKVPTYNGNEMYWSEKHKAYIYLTIAGTLSEEGAKAVIGIKDGTPVTVADSSDVNDSGKLDASDAQYVWNMYNAQYSEFTEDVTMIDFIKADRNADYKITTLDAVHIVNEILGNTTP